MTESAWNEMNEALTFAVSRIEGDQDPLNDRERADGNQYILRILAAVTEGSTMRLDADHPTFQPMLEAVRFVGGAGPDINYDVAAVKPDAMYRVSGMRGDASYVGIAVYAGAGENGATEIVRSVDVDEIMASDGSFSWEFSHPDAARVIVRQYFHDRATQSRGSWSIDRIDPGRDDSSGPAGSLPGAVEMQYRVANAAQSLRWNAQLNQLWTPDLRNRPNRFVRQTSADIVAAVPNPDVIYSTTWWKMTNDEVLVIDFTPPETRYWGLQLVDRWFQCFPDRRSNINNGDAAVNLDGSVRIVLSTGDPGVPNWLDTSGHTTGVLFFRWLHSDIDQQPICQVLPKAELASLG